MSYLFSNGSAFDYWRSQNCDGCKFDVDRETLKANCPMEEAIALNMADIPIPKELRVKYFGSESGSLPNCLLKNVDITPVDPRQVTINEVKS